jgi:hypothetical protein
MRLQFLIILVGGLILSTSLVAIESKETSSSMQGKETSEKNTSNNNIENLRNIHNENVISNHY